MMMKLPWFHTWLDAWALAGEAAYVIALRAGTFAAGGAEAGEEASRMISEKVLAVVTLQSLAAEGGLGHWAFDAADKTVAHYRHIVRQNLWRLSSSDPHSHLPVGL